MTSRCKKLSETPSDNLSENPTIVYVLFDATIAAGARDVICATTDEAEAMI